MTQEAYWCEKMTIPVDSQAEVFEKITAQLAADHEHKLRSALIQLGWTPPTDEGQTTQPGFDLSKEEGRLHAAQSLWLRFAEDIARGLELKHAKSRFVSGIQLALRFATRGERMPVEF